ncbi:MAG: hypothetical protein HC836_26275 [Richelia sp. RM2_1_2]|nr:hypothetical protein [Richelia sp. RM2_1_2]
MTTTLAEQELITNISKEIQLAKTSILEKKTALKKLNATYQHENSIRINLIYNSELRVARSQKTKLLRELEQEISNTKICSISGGASDYCVLWAGVGFTNLGFDVIIKRDLVKGIVREIDQVVFEQKVNFKIV